MSDAVSTVMDLDSATGTVTVDGYVDLYTAPLFRDSLQRACELGFPQVTVDLTACDFFDSTGLRALADTAGAPGVEVVVRGASPFVRHIIEISGIDAVVTFHS